MEGGEADDDFNSGVWIVPVKQLLWCDIPGTTSFARKALAARPLTLKCTDNIGIGGAVAASFRSVAIASTNPSQNGFAPCRQLLNNIVHTETSARAHAMRHHSSRMQRDFNYMLHPEQVLKLAVLPSSITQPPSPRCCTVGSKLFSKPSRLLS